MNKFYILHSPEDLRERIHLTLSQDPYVGGRAVRCDVIDSDVCLTGSVRSYFQKQMAQECLRGIEGLGRIVNQLEVVSTASHAF